MRGPVETIGSTTPPVELTPRSSVIWRLVEEAGRKWWTSMPPQPSQSAPSLSHLSSTMGLISAAMSVELWRELLEWLESLSLRSEAL